jgi:hypothetical protein
MNERERSFCMASNVAILYQLSQVEEEGAKDFADFEVTVASNSSNSSNSSKKRKLTSYTEAVVAMGAAGAAEGGEEGGAEDGDNSTTEGAGAGESTLSEFVRGRVRGLGAPGNSPASKWQVILSILLNSSNKLSRFT